MFHRIDYRFILKWQSKEIAFKFVIGTIIFLDALLLVHLRNRSSIIFRNQYAFIGLFSPKGPGSKNRTVLEILDLRLKVSFCRAFPINECSICLENGRTQEQMGLYYLKS